MINSNIITVNLVRELRSRNREYVIPNLYIGNWECDVYSETKKYSEEYEIKISRADYLNDFSKKQGFTNKHNQIEDGKRVNRFWYVVPMGKLKQANLIFPTDMPKYAGLVYFFFEENQFRMIKQAPLLSKESLLYPEAVVNACYNRYIHYSYKYYKDATKKTSPL